MDNRIKCFGHLTLPASIQSECIGIWTPVVTAAALMAFAANSILCRMALEKQTIDPVGFSILRLTTGAAVLWLLSATMRARSANASTGSWTSAIMLFSYALAFSFAFVNLKAGVGALILFATVQATLFTGALRKGERPGAAVYLGLAIALCGLGYLVSPGLEAPPLWSAGLMVIAGISWGIYTLRGAGAGDPLIVTRGNFTRTVPFAVLIGLFFLPQIHLSPKGALLAMASGGVASAAGYIVWYAALAHLRATHAALVQLLVPVLAAAGGVVFLSEQISLRLLLSAVFILGGIGLAICYPSLQTRKLRQRILKGRDR